MTPVNSMNLSLYRVFSEPKTYQKSLRRPVARSLGFERLHDLKGRLEVLHHIVVAAPMEHLGDQSSLWFHVVLRKLDGQFDQVLDTCGIR